MRPHTNLHTPSKSLSGRTQIGHKSGLLLFIIIIEVVLYGGCTLFMIKIMLKIVRVSYKAGLADL